MGDRLYLFERNEQVAWLTVYFETLVIDRDNQLRQAKGQKPITTVGPVRQQKFLDAARRLMSGSDAPTLAEVKIVLDRLFTNWLGYLPFVEDTEYPSDGKITRFWQIANNYPQLVAAMKKPETVPIRPTVTTTEEETMPRPKAYYDHGEGFPFEDQVAELVQGWIKTKSPSFRAHYDLDDFDDDDGVFDVLFAWRKTFRIMLGARKIPFEDVKRVVDALGDKSLHLDFSRYPTPYDMVDRPREWEKLLASVKLALLRRQMLTPAPRWDDDEFPSSFRYADEDDDGCGYSDTATNVEARHQRYLDRVARRSA